MKNKKGFTLIELLGTFVILIVVLGIVSISYININKNIKLSFYKTLEESILISGGEYFSYNKTNTPLKLGDEKNISLKDLVDNKYIDDVVDRDGNLCDLENSKVTAYKNSSLKTNYYICLKCPSDDYESSNCSNNITYSLQMNSYNKDNTIYKENTWTNNLVILKFKTYNDIEKVNVELDGKVIKTCSLSGNDLKTCNIEINESGTYTYYGISNSNETKKESISIKIDNIKPSYDVYYNEELIKNNDLNIKYVENNNIELNIENIKDLESGIKRIKYSFTKEGEKDNYKDIDIDKTSFTINEEIEVGNYKLIIQVIDNVNNINEKVINLNIYKEVNKPSSSYCNNLTYNGNSQVLTKENENGYTFINNTGINAGSYTVIARLDDNYKWVDGTSDDYEFTCQIDRLKIATVGSCKTLTYNGSSQYLVNGGSNVTYKNSEGKNAGSYTVNITSNSNYAFSDGLTSKTLSCLISKKDLTITPNSNQSKIYGALDPTLTYSYSGNITGETPSFNGSLTRNSGENIGTYLITVGSLSLKDNSPFLASNYNIKFSSTNVYFTINQKNISSLTISLSENSFTYDGTSKTPSVIVKDGNNTITTGYSVSYSNNINAGTGSVVITGTGNYTGSKTLTFTINKRSLTITASNQTITYGNSINSTTSYITSSGLVSGHSISSISLTQSTTNATTSGTITPSNAKIVSGSTDVSSNYSITYKSGTLVINKATTATVGSCKTLTYNGSSQTLASGGSNITYKNNEGTNAKSYTVTITANSNYAFSDGATSKTLTCSIAKKALTITASNQTITYGKSISSTTSYITSSGLVSGHTISSISLTQSTTNATTSGTITPSNAKIVSGSTDVSSNYSITYKSGTLVINKATTATVGSCKTLTYNGSSQTLASGGSNVSYSNNTGTNAGSYTVTVTSGSNYTFSDGSTSKTLSCSIAKKALTITASNQTITYGSSISSTTSYITSSGLVSGHSISSISLSQSTTNATTSGTITPSNGKIVSGSTDVSSNYTITYKTGTLVINKAKTATVGSCKTLTYNGSSQTLASGGSNITYKNNEGTNATSYTVSITSNSNYAFSDGSTSKTLSCSIAKKALTITAKAQTLTNGVTNISTGTSYITSSGLLSGHSISSITLTQSTTSSTENGTITPSNAKIVSGSTDISSNYSITYKTGTLIIRSTQYCANFYLNGASKIDGTASNKTNVCCYANTDGTCTITSPTITPATNYEVLGWSTSSSATSITQEAVDEDGKTASITLNSNTNLYAITRSLEDALKTYSIEFNLNGATSYTLQGSTYTSSNTFTCKTSLTYNGAALSTSCQFTLPTITRTNGNVYGWDKDQDNHGTPAYSSGATISVSSDLTLYAITSRTITLTHDGNGGTTTIEPIKGYAYNTETGASFMIPKYDNANMCRTAINSTSFSKGSFSANGYLLGYKYIGLATSSSSTTVEYCPGNYIYLENDTTLYALWNEDYATSLVTSGDSLNLRTGCSTNSSKTGSAMSGSTTLYIYQEGSAFSSGYMGYWLKYGSRNGCASSKYIRPITKYPEYNSCNRTDYSCNGGTVADITMTPSTMTLNLKDNTTGDIEVDSRCGTYTLASSDTSVATVSKVSGNTYRVSAVSGSVSENSKKTVTITATGQWGCTSTTKVVVKNSNDTPPTITFEMDGTSYSSGYKSGATLKITCSSSEGIQSFNVSNNKSKTFTKTSGTYSQTASATYTGSTSGWTVTATCTSVNDITTTVSKTYKIYTYSSNSACGVSSYSYSGTCKCTSKALTSTWLTTKSCNAFVYSYGSCSNYCSSVASLPVSSGSCTRSATYKKCWHT